MKPAIHEGPLSVPPTRISLAFVGTWLQVKTLVGLELPPSVSVWVALSGSDLSVPQLARKQSSFKNMCVVI